MIRHIATLSLFVLTLPAFGASYSAGPEWNKLNDAGRSIDTLSCTPKALGHQIADGLHMTFLMATMEAEGRNGHDLGAVLHGHDLLDMIRALDAFYKDPANLRIPIYQAYQHAGLQFAGATQQALGADLDKLRKASH